MHAIVGTPYSETFMPRDSDKNNDSPAAGVIGPRRQKPLRRRPRPGEEIRQTRFWRQGFCGKRDGDKRDGERRPYAGKSDGAEPYGKKPYAGAGKPYAGKREGASPRRDDVRPRRDFGDAPRPRFNRDDRPRGDRPDRERGRIFARARIEAARSARTRRAAIVRTTIAMTAHRAGIARATARDRDDARPAGRFAREEIRRQAAIHAAR